MLRTRTFPTLPQSIGVAFKLVGIPLICLIPVFVAVLYILGGADLLRFALQQLTWTVSLKIAWGIAVLVVVTWAKA